MLLLLPLTTTSNALGIAGHPYAAAIAPWAIGPPPMPYDGYAWCIPPIAIPYVIRPSLLRLSRRRRPSVP